MKRLLFIVLAMLLLSTGALAGDPEAGKQKSQICAACHGQKGISSNPQWPNLAGQKEAYLVTAIKAYRDGERENASMAPMVGNLTDEDIEDLAAFYAQLPCE